MRSFLSHAFALGVAYAALAVAPTAEAAFRGPISSPSGIEHVQGSTESAKKAKGDKAQKSEKAEKGKNKDKDKAKSSERSNASGEVRGADRAQEVQGMQDSGKGAQQRGQRPSK
jgi:hypothetical protein